MLLKKYLLNAGLAFAAIAFSTSTSSASVVIDPPVPVLVKDQNGNPIPQWSNPNRNIYIEVQLVRPQTNPNKTALIVIPGSGGGLPTDVAKSYANKGYPTLAVRYFDYSTDADFVFSITQLPLESFKTAFDWLKQNNPTPLDKIVLHGRSRGGEAALLVGSYYPKLFDGIIAEVPSSHAWGDRANGIWTQYLELQPNPTQEIGSWTFDGQEIPFVHMKGWLQTDSRESELNGLPLFSYVDAYEKALKEETKTQLELARIKVEKIAAPIFVSGGGLDQLWPSSQAVNSIQKSRSKSPQKSKDVYFVARSAGHVWDSSITEPFLFPSGVYDLAKPDSSNICAEPDLLGYLNSLKPVLFATKPTLTKGFPYSGHVKEILSLCSAPGAELYYYLAPEYADNGGTPKDNGAAGKLVNQKIDDFLKKIK